MNRLLFPKGRSLTGSCFILVLFMLPALISCSTLSKSQLKSVENFATGCDTFSRFPSLLYTGLSDLRKERGLYFASTLSTPETTMKELNSIYEASLQDRKLAKKMDASLLVIRRYASVLKTLSSENRSSVYGTEFRSLGRSLDSLLVSYNTLQWTKSLPPGILSLAGKITGFGAELISAATRTKLLKEFATEGDTLVSVLCNNLKGTISDYMTVLLENEKEMIKILFTSYVRQEKRTPEELAKYSELLDRAGNLSQYKTSIISAATSLRKAHSGMVSDLQEKKKFTEFYDDLNSFLDDVEKLKRGIK
ncbi:MAG: hypothetical protein PHP30_09455 [Bacteroidales bacterium]|nr:hypothetical protein [Bacteroidales bacterium]